MLRNEGRNLNNILAVVIKLSHVFTVLQALNAGVTSCSCIIDALLFIQILKTYWKSVRLFVVFYIS